MINSKHFKRIPLRLKLFILVVILLFIGTTLGVKIYYDHNLAPVSNVAKTEIVTIPSGASVNQISQLLKNRGLIRSIWAFSWYVHNAGLSSSLEAGTFALSPSDSTMQIAAIISSGHVAGGTITILPGKTILQVEDALINAGFKPAAVANAISPNNYAGVPIISALPAGTNTIEGLLYPDTFDKTGITDPTLILRQSLIEMGQRITAQMKSRYAAEGISLYQAIILASIIQQEVSKPSDMAQVAQVFFSRLKNGSPLGSDVTANYGAIIAGQAPSLSYDSPYNTLIHTGLPPTPIGTISLNALNAVAYPAPTNWLYFVTGDNGTTYFESTLQQHNADTAAYCHKLCALP